MAPSVPPARGLLTTVLSTERILRHEPHVAMRAGARARQPSRAAASQGGTRIVVDVERFRAYLAGYESAIRPLTEEFRGRATLELSYEEMSSNARGAIGSVLDFFGVERRPLRLQTERQSNGDVVNDIANLDEVAAAHRGTRWERVPDQR